MKRKEKNQLPESAAEEISRTPSVKRKKKRKKAPVIIIIVLIILVVFWMISCAVKPQAAAVVTVGNAERGELQESVSTSGTVSSEQKKVVFAPVNGRLGEVTIAAGDSVSAGDVLIHYDMEEMEKTLKQAALQQQKSEAVYNGAMSDNTESQAKLNEANTNLAVLEQQIADNKAYLKDLQNKLGQSKRDTSNGLADESYNLNQRLGSLESELKSLDESAPDYEQKKAAIQQEIQSVNSQISRNSYLQTVANSTDYYAKMEQEIADVQERIADYEEYKARMESQKSSSEGTLMDSYDKAGYQADRELAQLNYKQAEEEYYEAKQGIAAEFDAIVTECSAVSGAQVTDGAQLLTLESSDNLKVSFKASKYDLEKLETGQKADVEISGHTYEGEVSKIDRMASANESGTPMVGVEIHINNPDDRIILGLDAKLTIYTKKAENALLIPVEAVNADKNGDFLYVVENGVAVKKNIVCGISSDTYTEVLEGITENDQIILSSYTTVEEGMAVTVMPMQ